MFRWRNSFTVDLDTSNGPRQDGGDDDQHGDKTAVPVVSLPHPPEGEPKLCETAALVSLHHIHDSQFGDNHESCNTNTSHPSTITNIRESHGHKNRESTRSLHVTLHNRGLSDYISWSLLTVEKCQGAFVIIHDS